MGLATTTSTEYGYYVTGDTDPTPIWADGRKYVQVLAFSPGSTADTVIVSSQNRTGGTFTNLWSTASAGAAGVAQHLTVDGCFPATNLKVQFSSSSAKLYVYLRAR